MDRKERIEDINEVLLAALRGERADIWTALPGIVEAFDPVKMTCSVQPSVRFRILPPALNSYSSPTMTVDPSGQFAWDQMPLMTDCPVQFPGGGGVTLTFPLQVGDEVLLIIASRCIDAWWAYGGIQNQTASRMHDLSDGFVIPQVRSQARKFTVSSTAAQIRNDAGTAYIELNATTGDVNIVCPSATVTASGSVTVDAGIAIVTAATVTINGNVTVNGTITATGTVTAPSASITGAMNVAGALTNAGKNIGPAHVHTGVQTGPGNTGGIL